MCGVNRRDNDVMSIKESLLIFQAFICCDCLLDRNLLCENSVSPTALIISRHLHLHC